MSEQTVLCEAGRTKGGKILFQLHPSGIYKYNIHKINNSMRILDKLTSHEEFLRDIDKKKLLKTISEILNEIPPEQMKISEDELIKRIRSVLVLESVSGILNELTPEQIKDFDEAVKRRPLFK